ncbi:hypothetical protein [Streptacidiphilus neutrinimicus]|uniref:hypothetical protein n=1 Tax=Streptacidiphilus neutrinimicus TaxID=105420 RepID=UPI0005A8DDED|nr:hypothetical protein [Streptacidiphilus neutrinimicus]
MSGVVGRRIVAFGGVTGGPGVTTVVGATSAAWRSGAVRPLVWEADPAGGVLQQVINAGGEAGLVAVAGMARREGLAHDRVLEYAGLVGGVPVVTAPLQPGQAKAALEELAPLWEEAETGPLPWLVDMGRIDPSVQRPHGVWGCADALVLVTRGHRHALLYAALIAQRAAERGLPTVVAVVGACPESDREIARALGAVGVVRLPWDPFTAAVLRGQWTSLPTRRVFLGGRLTGQARRRDYPLVEAAAVLARELDHLLDTVAGHAALSPTGSPLALRGGA